MNLAIRKDVAFHHGVSDTVDFGQHNLTLFSYWKTFLVFSRVGRLTSILAPDSVSSLNLSDKHKKQLPIQGQSISVLENI